MRHYSHSKRLQRINKTVKIDDMFENKDSEIAWIRLFLPANGIKITDRKVLNGSPGEEYLNKETRVIIQNGTIRVQILKPVVEYKSLSIDGYWLIGCLSFNQLIDKDYIW